MHRHHVHSHTVIPSAHPPSQAHTVTHPIHKRRFHTKVSHDIFKRMITFGGVHARLLVSVLSITVTVDGEYRPTIDFTPITYAFFCSLALHRRLPDASARVLSRGECETRTLCSNLACTLSRCRPSHTTLVNSEHASQRHFFCEFHFFLLHRQRCQATPRYTESSWLHAQLHVKPPA